MVIYADEVRYETDLVVLAGPGAPIKQGSGYFDVQKR